MDESRLFDLEPHGPDTMVGVGPRYPWGGLYGGQIVGQALRAAASTVPAEFHAHSLRAYFIRRGDHLEPVRYEIDRIRNGRSFATRRVVARQATGALLNLEASFQVDEAAADVQPMQMPGGLPAPDSLEDESWSPAFLRRKVPRHYLRDFPTCGAGRTATWMKITAPLRRSGAQTGSTGPLSSPLLGGECGADDVGLLHRCWLAFLSDDLPTEAVEYALGTGGGRHQPAFSASLDHTIWFHRQPQVDEWHLHDFSCLGFVGGRGLALGQIYAPDGTHVATVAQEVLSRDPGDTSRATTG